MTRSWSHYADIRNRRHRNIAHWSIYLNSIVKQPAAASSTSYHASISYTTYPDRVTLLEARKRVDLHLDEHHPLLRTLESLARISQLCDRLVCRTR